MFDHFTLVESSCVLLIVLMLCHCALHDLAARTVPNFDCAAIALTGALLRLLSGGMAGALAASGLMFAAGYVLWRRGWAGGGDVKLLGACCLAVPAARVPVLLGWMLCAGGVLSAGYLLAGVWLRRRGPGLPRIKNNLRAPRRLHSGRRRGGIARLLRLEAWRARRGRAVPYAVAVAAGTLVALRGA